LCNRFVALQEITFRGTPLQGWRFPGGAWVHTRRAPRAGLERVLSSELPMERAAGRSSGNRRWRPQWARSKACKDCRLPQAERRCGNASENSGRKDHHSQQANDGDQRETSLPFSCHLNLLCLGCGHGLLTTPRGIGFTGPCQRRSTPSETGSERLRAQEVDVRKLRGDSSWVRYLSGIDGGRPHSSHRLGLRLDGRRGAVRIRRPRC